MVYVVLKDEIGTILNRIDAWVYGAEDIMKQWIKDSGFTLVEEQITMMGDMILWVE